MNTKSSIRFVNSTLLHILAMAFMLCDHMWATVISGNMWMTNIGRIAFPIFAFMLVEGFFHTKNIKKYIIRLLIAAIISEIPFNLMMAASISDIFAQNVIWSFLISLLCMYFTESIRRKNKYLYIPCGALIFGIGTLLGVITFVDYYGYGILMVAVFYFFKGTKWWQMLLQAAGLFYINAVMIGGMYIDVSFFGKVFSVPQQSFALFALIPIFLYSGKKGPGGKGFQLFCYLFYPVHILVLSILGLFVL